MMMMMMVILTTMFFNFLVRKCSPLKAPIFGSIYPHMCTSSPVSGTTCYFQCSYGFMDDGGINATYCGKDGQWTREESEILQCVGKSSVCLL